MAQQTDARGRSGRGRPGVRLARVARPVPRRVLEASEPGARAPSIDLTCINTIRTLSAWRVAAQLRHEPALLVMSRQALPTLDRTKFGPAKGLAKGAYVLADASRGKVPPEVILIGTGSEVSLCVEAYERLVAKGVRARVVSMPSWELFERQPQGYRDTVLPPDVTARVSVEQASTFGWERWVGMSGVAVGMRTFGASAPIKDLVQKFGFTVDAVVAAALKQIGRGGRSAAASVPAGKTAKKRAAAAGRKTATRGSARAGRRRR